MNRFLVTVIAVMFLISCKGALWEGNDSDSITITIDNPFYQGGPSSSVSRAMALQGQYLYIELALITDQAAYNADTEKALTGNGSWVTTAWGGHAIVAVGLSVLTESVLATFTDVPRDQDLKARAILDVSDISFADGMAGLYTQTPPVCHTYDSAALDLFDTVGTLDIFDWWWITIPAVDLATNVLSLPIRPLYPEGQLMIFEPIEGNVSQELYIDATGLELFGNTEPSPGNTRFQTIDVNITTMEGTPLVDFAVYLLTEADFPPGTPLPGVAGIYDGEGNPAAEVSGNTFSSIPVYPYRSLSLAFPIVDNLYQNSEFFIGSTVFSGLPLNVDNPLYTTGYYNLSYGFLYDERMSAFYSTGFLYVYWTIPWVLQDNDLEFRIIYIQDPAGITDESSIETIAQIESFTDELNIGWANYVQTEGFNENFSFTPTVTEFSWVIILARTPGGTPFIFARYQIPAV